MWGIILIHMCVLLLGSVALADWSEECPVVCRCKWISGKKAADCKQGELRSIPHLSSEIQILDMSENILDNLPADVFMSAGLVNMHRLVLRACEIKSVHRDAFKSLKILIEVDLSENKIQKIHPGTFSDNAILRSVILNHNYIKALEKNVVSDLHLLQTIEMVGCKLTEIDVDAFRNTTNLLTLKLNENMLKTISLPTLTVLSKLRSLVLYENPWQCDCHLRDLRNWVIERNLYSDPTTCIYPTRLRNKKWTDVQPELFACKPKILWPSNDESIQAVSKDVDLSCQVTGNPLPEVQWYYNSRILSNDTKVKYNANRYTIKTSSMSDTEMSYRWVNLTIHEVGSQDKGQFQCKALSPGGTDEINVTLIVDAYGGVIDGFGHSIGSWPWIIGLITGMAALLIILCLIFCWICCRGKQAEKSAANSNKQEESLLTVNPIQKPPRCYETQISPNNDDGNEVFEFNRKLLDENSLHETTCTSEDDQSPETLESRHEPQPFEKNSREAHPPDLLAFPLRGSNISPASSSTSKGFDNLSRASLNPALKHSLHSTPLHYNFGTLPYSRSHSPLSPAVPVVLPRHGYVTIPRRPRIPSWSSAPTPTLLDDPSTPIGAEPIYDNLGPRTTADGSSVLSLNKSVPENPPKRRNISNQPYYFHFESPCPSPLSPDKDKKNEFLKRTGSAENEVTPARPHKVAPKPPPKPPKKDGPLFEDEGEDGTEV